jgi:hypothetical protein
MSLLVDTPSGARPPSLGRTSGLWMATALVIGDKRRRVPA